MTEGLKFCGGPKTVIPEAGFKDSKSDESAGGCSLQLTGCRDPWKLRLVLSRVPSATRREREASFDESHVWKA